jgi:hypothetical protein
LRIAATGSIATARFGLGPFCVKCGRAFGIVGESPDTDHLTCHSVGRQCRCIREGNSSDVRCHPEASSHPACDACCRSASPHPRSRYVSSGGSSNSPFAAINRSSAFTPSRNERTARFPTSFGRSFVSSFATNSGRIVVTAVHNQSRTSSDPPSWLLSRTRGAYIASVRGHVVTAFGPGPQVREYAHASQKNCLVWRRWGLPGRPGFLWRCAVRGPRCLW